MKKLNYCTQAIDDLRKHGQGKPDYLLTLKVCSLLAEAEKYRLPDNGELVHRWGQTPNAHPAGRLPYPLTVVETPWTRDLLGDFESLQVDSSASKRTVSINASSRRICLSFEVEYIDDELTSDHLELQKMPSILRHASSAPVKNPMGRVTIAIYYLDAARKWVINPAGLFQPYDLELGAAPDGEAESDKSYRKDMDAMLKLHGLDAAEKGSGIPLLPVMVLPADYKIFYAGRGDKAFLGIRHDVANETIWVQGLVTSLSHRNVGAERVEPSLALASERKRRRKAPAFAYNFIKIGDEFLQPELASSLT